MTVLAGLAVALMLMSASPVWACASHRFETFTLPAPALERDKRLLIYLPPGYGCSDVRYPVLYANDGHDLFAWNPFAAELDPALAREINARENWYGSWRLAEQLDRAIAEGTLPAMIVVGIASDDGLRSRDLAPVPWDGSAEARGVAYGAFVADTVTGVIDRSYRTVADRRCRAIAGASLGAISALQIGLAHDETFGMVLALSPVLRDPAIAGFVAARWQVSEGYPTAFVFDLDDDPIAWADREWLQGILGDSSRITVVQSSGSRHDIASWADRVIPALTTLYDEQCPG